MMATLVDRKVVPELDPIVWGKWMTQFDKRVVEQTRVEGLLVSTVFLGLDHNYIRKGPGFWFETMVFGKTASRLIHRYSTWEDAVAGHKNTVEKILQKAHGRHRRRKI